MTWLTPSSARAPDIPAMTAGAIPDGVAPEKALPKEVRIFADASRHEESGVSGWAVWIEEPGGVPHQHWGVLLGEFQDSNAAEMAALGKGIRLARKLFDLRAGDSLVLLSDSLHSLEILDGRKALRGHRCEDRAVQMEVMDFLACSGVKIRCRHIPGHLNINRVPRSQRRNAAINAWCDQVSRAQVLGRIAGFQIRSGIGM